MKQFTLDSCHSCCPVDEKFNLLLLLLALLVLIRGFLDEDEEERSATRGLVLHATAVMAPACSRHLIGVDAKHAWFYTIHLFTEEDDNLS